MGVDRPSDPTETAYFIGWGSHVHDGHAAAVTASASVQHGWGNPIEPILQTIVSNIGARRHELIAACVAHLTGHEPEDETTFAVADRLRGLRFTEHELRQAVDAGVQRTLL